MQGMLFSPFWKLWDGPDVLAKQLSAEVADLKGCGCRGHTPINCAATENSTQWSTLLTSCYKPFLQHWCPLLQDGKKKKHFQAHHKKHFRSTPNLYTEGKSNSLLTSAALHDVFMFFAAWWMSSAYDPFPNYQVGNWKCYNGSVNRLNRLQMNAVE